MPLPAPVMSAIFCIAIGSWRMSVSSLIVFHPNSRERRETA
jgi:hypothetical protein